MLCLDTYAHDIHMLYTYIGFSFPLHCLYAQTVLKHSPCTAKRPNLRKVLFAYYKYSKYIYIYVYLYIYNFTNISTDSIGENTNIFKRKKSLLIKLLHIKIVVSSMLYLEKNDAKNGLF